MHPSQAPYVIAGCPFQVEAAEEACVRPPSLWGRKAARLPRRREEVLEERLGGGAGEAECEGTRAKDALTAACATFLECGQEGWLDVCQLEDQRDRYAGRAQGFSTKRVQRSGIQEPRAPRHTPEAAWIARVASTLKAAARAQVPRGRIDALDFLPRLAGPVPQRV
eukprot:6144982-Pyramimonas_sp.AAC.1